ncbi:MAG TPA: glycosyltransferase, partial [Flavitalea sp.]|nr:glycosyltransferase [Flavitalea sp.]
PYYGWLALLLKYFLEIKIVLHAHNIEANRFHTVGKWWWKILWYYEQWIHRNANTNFFIHNDDRNYAINHFGLNPSKCFTITYGIEWSRPPSVEERKINGDIIRHKHGVPQNHQLFLFNGAFDYKPNEEALGIIINQINPLLTAANYPYSILICGRNIPPAFTRKKIPNIIIAGFVEDVSAYFKAADVFMNPITDGGGIKTKLVEALGYNVNCVSTPHGAIGIDRGICGNKLKIVNDWNSFALAVTEISKVKTDIPDEYYEHFYWENIARKAAESI